MIIISSRSSNSTCIIGMRVRFSCSQLRIHMSPVELRMNRVSLQTEWWTAVCLLLSVSLMWQQDNVCGSSSVCCHCSCSSQSRFSSTQQRPAANDNTRTDCSSHTPENKDRNIIFIHVYIYISLKHQMCFSVFSLLSAPAGQTSVAVLESDPGDGGLVVELTGVLLSDGLQQTICRTFRHTQQRNGG